MMQQRCGAVLAARAARGYVPPAMRSENYEMWRKFTRFLLALGFAAALAGCDKCGDWLQPRVPNGTKACGAATGRS
jgi:hypothetical protein